MAAMTEACSVCSKAFDVQFRYQMEEKDGGFAFFCSQECQGKSVRGEDAGGATCDACGKRFSVELVSQVVRVRAGRKYACSDACRAQVLAEASGARLSAFVEPLSAAPTSASGAAVAAIAAATTFAGPPSRAAGASRSTPTVEGSRSSAATARGPSVATGSAAAVPSAELLWGADDASAALDGAPSASRTGASPEPPMSPPFAGSSPGRPPATAPAVSADRRARQPMYGPRRLAIFNHKGGTGKTTTSVSVAAGLAARGLRVLLVDTDSQGNVGVSLAVKAERSLYHVLVMGLKAQDAAINVRSFPATGGALDLIPSNETLAAAELYLAGRQNRDRVLRERLASVADSYDVLLLDCSPSLSLMNQNALVTCDGILVPVACDFLSLVGVRQVLKTVKNVNALLHHPVQIFGVLPTFYDARARICRDAVETMRDHFGDKCLPPIRATIKVKEAPAQGRTIFEYAADSNASEDYRRVVDFIVDGPAALASRPDARDEQPRAATA